MGVHYWDSKTSPTVGEFSKVGKCSKPTTYIKKKKTNSRVASRWQKSKTWRSPSSPQIHQKYIYKQNNSYRTPNERWQNTSDLRKDKKLSTYLGRSKEKTDTKE